MGGDFSSSMLCTENGLQFVKCSGYVWFLKEISFAPVLAQIWAASGLKPLAAGSRASVVMGQRAEVGRVFLSSANSHGPLSLPTALAQDVV